MSQTILDRTTDGDGLSFTIDGICTIGVDGTWDGASVQAYRSLDGGTTWVSLGSSALLSANGTFNLELYGAYVKLTVASAGASTDLTGYKG